MTNVIQAYLTTI